MNPITGIAGCCARATSGHIAAPPRKPKNSRRLMRSPLTRGSGYHTDPAKALGLTIPQSILLRTDEVIE
jgi:hypothetical protein